MRMPPTKETPNSVLSIRRICSSCRSQLWLPFISLSSKLAKSRKSFLNCMGSSHTIRKQFLLIVKQLLSRLSRILGIR